MNLFRYILPVLAAFSLLSCSEDVLPISTPGVIDSGDTFTTAISLNVAEMNVPSSRVFSDAPDYGNLKLYVLEFRYNPESTIVDCEMIQKYEVQNKNVNADGDIHFNLTLNKTHEPRVLHFIAVPEEINLNIPYGLEGVVIPPVAVGDRTPAYWQRVKFPDGYAHYTQETLEDDELNSKLELNADTKDKLTHIPMLCNFAKITVTDNVDNDDFELTGFVVCNQPMHGYIAPWDAEASAFPDFINESGELKSFDTINEDYKGRTHEADNPIIPNNLNDFSLESQYLYERTVTSLHNPFIIIRGTKNGQTRYYKLDIGHKNSDENSDEFNMFEYYDVLRNFDYKISLNKVDAEGYASAEEAFNGVVYNNFSFDLTTKSMLNVSNGEAMLWVDKTTIVVTSADETTQSLSFRLAPNVNSGSYDNTNIKLLNYKTGDAIAERISDDMVVDGWRTITFKTVNPSLERKMQEFIIYNKNSGLGRVITVIVRNPWEFKNCMVWGGNYNTYEQFNAVATADNATANTPEGVSWNKGWEGKVPSTAFSSMDQQSMTVTFRIEDNIPEAMFPLDFVFEAGNQNITQNTIGDLIVQTAKSMFNSNNTRIQYVKTITWADYNAYLTWDNQRGTIVKTAEGAEFRVIRGRFSTTSTIGPGEESTIRVANPYMHLVGSENDYFDVTFTGVDGVAPFFPITDTLTPDNAEKVTHPN